jgi:hypothetical protein
MVVTAALTADTVVTDAHSLIANADALRSGLVEHIGQTVERDWHGFDYPGKVEDGVISHFLFRDIVEGRGDHRHILDPRF